MNNTPDTVKKYLSKIGKKGGKKSKRELTSEQAREMVKARLEKKQAEIKKAKKDLEKTVKNYRSKKSDQPKSS